MAPKNLSIAALSLCSLLQLSCVTSFAADLYPSKPVRVVVPFPASGGSDTLARTVSEALQKSLKQPFVVENRAGATGNIGTDVVAKAPADGYTLLVVPNSLSINDALFPKLPFNAQKDLTPVALLGSSPVVVAVSSSLPVNSVRELIAHAKANPGKLSYASCGSGSPQHLAGELFKMAAKVYLTHIPYKGCAPAAVDTAGGIVEVVFNTVANLRPFIESGKVRALAVTSAKRSAIAPNLPTVQEAGLSGYDVDVWFGMLAPAGTPPAVITLLNAEINKTLSNPDVRDRMAKLYYEPVSATPQQFADLIKRDTKRYGDVITRAKITTD